MEVGRSSSTGFGIHLINSVIKGLGFILAVTMFFFTVVQPQLTKIAVNENRITRIEENIKSVQDDIKCLLQAEARRSGRDETTNTP